MNMRGSRRARGAAAVPARAFAWERALLATLRHSTLPFDETLALTPLIEIKGTGARDRLSLLAQFAAHQALLQFAGVADGDFDPNEWAVVQKRGSDVRLVRTSARAVDADAAPPVLTLAQQFAEQVGAQLEVLGHSWARADAVYAEAHAALANGAAADLRWMRASACGAIAAPGPEGLRTIVMEPAAFAYDDADCIDSLERFADDVIVLRGASPLARYSALGELVADASLDPAAAAERIIAAHARPLFAVTALDAFDAASRQVIDLLMHARHGSWLTPHAGEALPSARRFVVSPRLAARRELETRIESRAWLDDFVASDAFGAYLAHGDVPPARTILPTLAEPARSYVGALALLGKEIPRELATKFLGEFLFRGALEELAVDGVTRIENDALVFTGDATGLIPRSSRGAICRVAAVHARGVRAAMLWLDGGDNARASQALEESDWSSAEEIVAALRKVPLSILTPALAEKYAHALIDCGRYRDARELAPLLEGDARELVLARAERRSGDYAPALQRLERTSAPSREARVLHAELLRVTRRYDEAARVLNDADDYERALLAFDARGDVLDVPLGGYHAARFATYVALERGDYDEAARNAAESHAQACNTAERVDASLDRLFATFSAGRWDEARIVAVEALQEVEETQGDRAAGGILFTLAYLAADQAQWAHASQRIARLRHFYAGTRDELRLLELQLLSAHLDFSRGRFDDARRAASEVFAHRQSPQIAEAAALILDELDWIDGKSTRRAKGNSGNVELARRKARIGTAPHGDSIPDRLYAFRYALAMKDHDTAKAIAQQLGLVIDAAPAPTDVELQILRTAATREFPFVARDFALRWCFASRNRLGHWNVIGSQAMDDPENAIGLPDWIECSDRELLYLEGASRWSNDGRDAVAALFRTRSENHRLRRIVEQEEQARPAIAGMLDGIVGESAQMREVAALVTRIARRDVPVCILGESGTGKELVARAIHRHSPRRPKPFTPVNCAALPENLIESELFGHVRGAFTGADRDRAGLIETTDGGTLFLDEIGELPLGAQAKLLRFLQEGEFRRVGDTNNRSADVRIVSATNRKLEAAVEEGRFRDDLYYRIRGVEVLMPPLRERGGDVVLLASHFLRSEKEKHRGGPSMLAPDVESIFAAYPWPGNVRELQNTIRAAHAMAGDAKEIEVEHLPERLRGVAPSRLVAGSYQDAVSRFKRDLIERSLVQAKGNQNRAATLLKMSRQALAYQIRELGILVAAKA